MRGSSFPSPLSMKTTLRVPVGITALTGMVSAVPMSISSSAFTYIPGRSLKSGFGISMRTLAVRCVEKRINQTDRTVEVLARIRLCGDGKILSHLKHRQLILVKFCPQPDDAEVGNFYKQVSRFYALALLHGH